jgi:hypothetical protein
MKKIDVTISNLFKLIKNYKMEKRQNTKYIIIQISIITNQYRTIFYPPKTPILILILVVLLYEYQQVNKGWVHPLSLQ